MLVMWFWMCLIVRFGCVLNVFCVFLNVLFCNVLNYCCSLTAWLGLLIRTCLRVFQMRV